ncbi:MAG: DEAD/DEAH box helicase [Deltaproteobacteria bacterium]|nr:DEAD/DEAH box helicase [Deltaproteobacteria bacterium]
MELRPYQKECLTALYRAWRDGRRRVLVSLPTGTGKTVIFACFPSFFRMKKRMLVLAHREELLEQALEKFRALAPELKVGVEQSTRSAAPDCNVVLASVGTLGRDGSRRLAALNPEDFYLIVVDEAHHAVAPTYRRILQHLKVFEPESKRLLVGFTATPRRGDGQGLGEVFEQISYTRGIEEMIRAGFLCGIAGWRVRTGVELGKVRVVRGDFAEGQLARAVNTPARNEMVLRAWRKIAGNRRTLVFCVDVQHAQDLAARFTDNGIAAAAIYGDMPSEDRRQALRRFSSGELQVLTNCNVLTEGFDEPRVDCVLLARPTKSLLLYAQMVGRGTRLHAEKNELAVIDVVDNSDQHTLAGLNRLFDLPGDMDLRGAGVVPTMDRLRDVAARFPWIELSHLQSAGDLQFVTERVDLFKCDTPSEIAPFTSFTWLPDASGGYRLVLGGGRQLEVRRNLLERWEVLQRNSYRDDSRPVAVTDQLERALAYADRLVREQSADALALVERDARWRDKEPTEAQLQQLQRLAIPRAPDLTRGQASWIIAMALARGPGSRQAQVLSG